ncbi:MAG: hypothetical protein HJJLKODD_01594 [Phycisphaerae bacterium]|nr:hypothetical protein [Phycisphaerae bacterium]
MQMSNRSVELDAQSVQVSAALQCVDRMLLRSHWIFEQTSPHQVTIAEIESTSDAITDADTEINQLEEEVRRQVLQRLTQQADFVPIGLLLLSISRDAERVGDYAKNIFEVLLYCGPSRYASMHVGEFQLVRTQLVEMIQATRAVLQNHQPSLIRELVLQAEELARQMDFLVQQFLEVQNPQAKEPAATVLLARHYRRIAKHLGNICRTLA